MTSQIVLEALPLLPKFFTEQELIDAIHVARKKRVRPTEPYPEGLAIKEEVMGKLREVMPDLISIYNVSRLGVFGSVIQGTATEESDVDIYLELTTPSSYFYLTSFLEDKLHKRVDIITEGFSNKEVLKNIHATAQFLR